MDDNPNALGIEAMEIQAPLEVKEKLISAGYPINSEDETSYLVNDPDGSRHCFQEQVRNSKSIAQENKTYF